MRRAASRWTPLPLALAAAFVLLAAAPLGAQASDPLPADTTAALAVPVPDSAWAATAGAADTLRSERTPQGPTVLGIELPDPLRFGGNATMTSDLYHSSGIDARRPGSAWRMNLTPQATLFGTVTMNFDILLSSEQSEFRQNINQIGINPTWRWGGVHLGDFSRDYSPYTVQGMRVRGAGLDLHPGIFRASVHGGRLQRMAAGALDGPVYRRNMIAASAGVGREMGTHLNLSVISARDDLREEDLIVQDTILVDTIHADLRPQIATLPQENLAVGADGQLVLFKNVLTLSGAAATSLYTRDLTADSVDLSGEDLPVAPGVIDHITDRHAPRLSSSVDYAYQMEGALALRSVRLRGGYEYVGPGYASLGLPYLINDRQSYHVNGLTRLWDGRLAVQAQYRTQTNNLLGQKLNTVDRNTANASVSARLSDRVTTTVSGLVTTLANDAPSDSAKLDTRSYAITTNTAVQREVFGRASVLSLGYSLQRTEDGAALAAVPSVTTHNVTGSVQLSLTPTISVAPSLSGAVTRGEGVETRENVFFGFSGSGRFLDGDLRTTANLSHTTSQGRQIHGAQFRASYPLGWGADLSFQARHTRYGAFGDRPAFQESFATTSISRSF
jgi:hypothetical protein